MAADYPPLAQALDQENYQAALERLGELAAPLAAFFDQVMVVADDPALRENRLALLGALQDGFDRVADLSLLPG
ncbi:hypothetical protein L0B52_05590 [Suttonella sp. R2A3]|uniref:DALR anticodon-binding domain-containing protein n=1 Tax=Suttonella sp. R2A3 TaxID=2908648 RepID=UPI001F43B41F|nr:DALR anticodon-binding domain-containing protein [Suttonella sp. R2A3]UJF23823.1 hypothetical protein L0B52_05590 [Suttonella sp. R2A3]